MSSTEQSTWGRLRWPVKALIIIVPILACVWGASKMGLLSKPADNASTNTTTTSSTTAPANTSSSEGKSSSSSAGNSTEHRSFAYQPEKPVNGVLKGVVEVGASGFNSFVINIDKEKHWEIITKDFGQSLVYEGLATTDDIRSGLKKYLAGMFDRGVQNKNMHFVISSGAQKEPKTAGIVSELKKMGYVVNLVTPEQEGKLALRSVQPPSYQDNSFVADIGSGNTKVSYYENGSIKAMEMPGAKYFEMNKTDESVYNEVKQKAGTIPAAKREVCFIIGGVPYELAKQTRQGEERYTVLNTPATYSSDKQKVKSGINIYKGLVDATNCDTFVFDWDANFTIGFLLTLP
jgi:hypothetical protein